MNQVSPARITFERSLLGVRRTVLVREIFALAFDGVRSSKLRFALTMLGMVIGTASVILVVTIGLTGKQYVLQELQKIETNSIEVEYAGIGAMGSERVLNNDDLTREDEIAVSAQLPGVVYSSPVQEMHDRISFGGAVVKDILVLGVSPQYRNIRNLLVTAGRFFDEEDGSAHFKCAVVSESFAREMFGSSNSAVGQTFEISGIPFTIIGVFKESVDDFGASEIVDQTVVIPFPVARYLSGTENVTQIYFSMRNMEEVTGAANEIVRIIQSRHRPGSVYVAQTLKDVLAIAAEIADALTAVLVLVAIVTLVVGGVGIMNMMLADVHSRVHEIGVRKALGATEGEITAQFLVEAVIISLTGGVIGAIIGLAMPLSLRFFTDYTLPISTWSVVIALGAAALVGVIFGTVPATRAAQMDPVEALRHE
jgi:putative ABC transport system permease protein